jgi:hypothetical protein
MLFKATLLVDLSAMAITLWMAFYLFARGFTSRITLRGVIVLLALSIFFFSAYNNLFHQVVGTAALRAVMLIIGLGTLHSLTYQLAAGRNRQHLYWPGIGIYVLGAGSTFLLVINRIVFIGEQGNILYVARMGIGLPYMLYGFFQFVACAGILYNLLKDNKIGLTSQGRFFLLASMFSIAGVGYGVLALAIVPPMPRLFQDLLVFSGVFLLGMSVVRHQAMVERRTMLQDFPLTSLTVLLLASTYAFLGLHLGLQLEMTASVVAFAVITHAMYDLAREYLERLRFRKESDFRKHLRQLESDNSAENALRVHLQEGLDLLSQSLNASGGLIAIRQGDEFLVTATRQSLPVDSHIAASLVSCDDVCQPKAERIPYIAWIAPSFEGQTQVAIVGIGKPKARLEYSAGDLDLLAEVADQVGTIVSLSNLRPNQKEQIRQLVAESQANVTELISIAGEMIETIETNPDLDFIKIVEESLRNLPDYIALGQCPLANKLAIKGESHIERGKQLQQLLIESIESLKPEGKRPAEPLPRFWYNHAVLYDAYVEGVPNREIMARLYISEGTFNRTRRNALRGLARLLIEKNRAGKIR